MNSINKLEHNDASISITGVYYYQIVALSSV